MIIITCRFRQCVVWYAARFPTAWDRIQISVYFTGFPAEKRPAKPRKMETTSEGAPDAPRADGTQSADEQADSATEEVNAEKADAQEANDETA